MAYPSYGYFNAMFVHPPTHYLFVALVIKAGVPLAYASAIPPLVLILVSLWLITRSLFSDIVKASLLFGFFGGAIFLWAAWHRPFGFGLRPDMHLAFAWFAGLVALESGRLADWDPARLFSGSFLLAYASGLHYPAVLAWIGVLVYLAWLLHTGGWHSRPRSVMALISGACLFGVPYLTLFVLPHLKEILTFIRSASPVGGTGVSVGVHLDVYRGIYNIFQDEMLSRIIFYPLVLQIPTILLSATVLIWRWETRGLALASLPHLLFVLLAVQRKSTNSPYLIPEIMLYLTAVAVLALAGVRALATRLAWPGSNLIGGGSPVLLAGLLIGGIPWVSNVHVAAHPRLHEMELARAAGRSMLGPNALVGHRLARFYASGAAYSYLIEADLFWPTGREMDPKSYAGQFDALAEDHFGSHISHNESGDTLASWYGKGTLDLRGFYFSYAHSDLSYLLLAAGRRGDLEGYGLLESGQVAYFHEKSDGDHVFIAAVCDSDVLSDATQSVIFRNVYRLPVKNERDEPRQLLTWILGPERTGSYKERLNVRCEVRDIVPLHRRPLDPQVLNSRLADDQPIRFYKELPGALDARYGPAIELGFANDGWPQSIRFLRGELQGERFDFGPDPACPELRADMEDIRDWELRRVSSRAVLEAVTDGLTPGDLAAWYKSGVSADRVLSPVIRRTCRRGEFIFFSLWIRPVGDPRLPRLTLLDVQEAPLATAWPALRRADGWVLLAGWSHVESGRNVRLVIEEGGRRAFLFDKAFVTGFGARADAPQS
jgi:hypothetical protein